MGEALVDLEGIGVSFAGTPVLTSVSLRVDPGQVIGIAGPNGAGKTTLLSVVATLVAPTSGAGTVLGARLGTRQVVRIRPRLGWSGHDPGLYSDLTLAENLRLWADVAGRPASEADAALEMVGLARAADRRADRSSNGMQRRVDLARLLMLRPSLVLLDEAHAGLDQDAETIVDEIIRRARLDGGGALLVSHDATRLRMRVDQVQDLSEGRISA
jgi:ABC-type multidrug transport system ATPase subunit